MSEMQRFSEAEISYHDYLRRLDRIRVEATWKGAIARAEARADEMERRADEMERRVDEMERRADEMERRADEMERHADEAEQRLQNTERRPARGR